MAMLLYDILLIKSEKVLHGKRKISQILQVLIAECR